MYTIFGVGAFQSFIFSLLLLTKKEKKNADKFLAGFFFIVAIYLANVFSKGFGLWKKFPEIILLITLVKVTYGPLLYFYVKSLIGQTISRKQILLNLIPIVSTYLIILPFMFYSRAEKIQYFSDRFINLPVYMSIGALVEYVIAPCYFIAILVILRKYKQYLKNNHSSIDGINLNWIRGLLIGVISIWMLETINAFALNYTRFNIDYGIALSIYIKAVLMVFIVLIGFYGIKQGKVFSNNNKPVEDRIKEEDLQALVAHLRNEKPENNVRIHDIAMNLNIPIHVLSHVSNVKVKREEEFEVREKPKLIADDVADRHLKTLQEYMHNKKAYLNSELLIQDIAVKLDIPSHHISYVINTKLNQNFYDFVNQYRIEEAKQRLCDPAHEKITIIGIAFDCGFNSKATFNRLFKKYTGLTPSQYKSSNS